MADVNRRQFLELMAATTCVAVLQGEAAATVAASQMSECSNGLFLLAANSSRVSDLRPGWLPIIAATLEKMYAIDPEFGLSRIDQKFGGLRIGYRSQHRERLRPAVEDAEFLCGKMCEECGGPGSLVNQDGFFRTLCEQHLTVRSPAISVILLARPLGESDGAKRPGVVEADVRFIYVEKDHESRRTRSAPPAGPTIPPIPTSLNASLASQPCAYRFGRCNRSMIHIPFMELILEKNLTDSTHASLRIHL